ncbi:MAG: hypothetical protein HQL68_05720 [Magnetococcales bacterium]|nr:hypothetical protein [Magnetococcales bacterium]
MERVIKVTERTVEMSERGGEIHQQYHTSPANYQYTQSRRQPSKSDVKFLLTLGAISFILTFLLLRELMIS